MNGGPHRRDYPLLPLHGPALQFRWVLETRPDPTLDPKLASALRSRCPSPRSSSVDNTVNLDQNSASDLIVDNSFYKQTVARRGLLQIDQELALDPLTKSTAAAPANATNLFCYCD